MTGLMDIFDDESNPENHPEMPVATPPWADSESVKKDVAPSTGAIYGSELPDEVRQAAQNAAQAADDVAEAKAALDYEKGIQRAKLDKLLDPLEKSLKAARDACTEASSHLMKVMKAEKITKIPMDDRPEISIKVTPGRKGSITLKWLSDPEGVVVKKYGPLAPKTIWDAVPRTQPKADVVIPPRYEDEPES